MINETDKRILKILQDNSRTTNAEIARQIGMAPSAILERVRKLEERGVIKGYGAQLAGHAIGRGLLAFIFVRLEDMAGESKAAKAMARLPEALEVHHVAGEDCFLVKVRAASTTAPLPPSKSRPPMMSDVRQFANCGRAAPRSRAQP